MKQKHVLIANLLPKCKQKTEQNKKYIYIYLPNTDISSFFLTPEVHKTKE